MSKDYWVVNSDISETAFIAVVKQLREQHKYITFSEPKVGPDRSVPQNSLLHMWLSEYAAKLLDKDKKKITDGELEGMKRHAKGEYYRETGLAHMVHKIINPKTGQSRNEYTSSANWARGEMFAFLNWLQMMAANDGLVLESKGEYAKFQRQQNQ